MSDLGNGMAVHQNVAFGLMAAGAFTGHVAIFPMMINMDRADKVRQAHKAVASAEHRLATVDPMLPGLGDDSTQAMQDAVAGARASLATAQARHGFSKRLMIGGFATAGGFLVAAAATAAIGGAIRGDFT